MYVQPAAVIWNFGVCVCVCVCFMDPSIFDTNIQNTTTLIEKERKGPNHDDYNDDDYNHQFFFLIWQQHLPMTME